MNITCICGKHINKDLSVEYYKKFYCDNVCLNEANKNE